MEEKSFSLSYLVDKTPQEVYDAILNVRGWWDGEITGNTDILNDEFSYRVGDLHYSKQKITILIPEKKIVWLITDSFVGGIKDEWTGTEVSFTITPKDGKTEVTFKHEGLVPSLPCYEACTGGWTTFFGKSLYDFITTGKGIPDLV